MKRPRYTSAVIQALDKVTAQTLRFEAPINKPIRYKSLIFVVRACETTAADEGYQRRVAHVEMNSQPLPTTARPRRRRAGVPRLDVRQLARRRTSSSTRSTTLG